MRCISTFCFTLSSRRSHFFSLSEYTQQFTSTHNNLLFTDDCKQSFSGRIKVSIISETTYLRIIQVWVGNVNLYPSPFSFIFGSGYVLRKTICCFLLHFDCVGVVYSWSLQNTKRREKRTLQDVIMTHHQFRDFSLKFVGNFHETNE